MPVIIGCADGVSVAIGVAVAPHRPRGRPDADLWATAPMLGDGLKAPRECVWLRPRACVIPMPCGHILPNEKRLKLVLYAAQVLRSYARAMLEEARPRLPAGAAHELQQLLRDVGESAAMTTPISDLGGLHFEVPAAMCEAEQARLMRCIALVVRLQEVAGIWDEPPRAGAGAAAGAAAPGNVMLVEM